MMPAPSQRAGVTAPSNEPRATQLSAERSVAAMSPARPPRSAQASANRTGTSSIASGRAGRERNPSAAAASGGTATSARYVSPWALAVSASRAINTKARTDAGRTAAQPPARRRSRAGVRGARGSATSAP